MECIESAPGGETLSDPNISTTESSLHNMKTIHDLPVEMLKEIFGYLTHTEKLISRLVCTDWNNQISTDLGRKAQFEVSEETMQVLNNSNVEWTKIKLSSLGLKLPEKIMNTISTLQVFDICGLKKFMEVLVGFPKLTSLDFVIGEKDVKAQASDRDNPDLANSDLESDNPDSSNSGPEPDNSDHKAGKSENSDHKAGKSDPESDNAVPEPDNSGPQDQSSQKEEHLKVQFHKFAEKLKFLMITFELKDFGAFFGFMKELDGEMMVLTELSIEEREPSTSNDFDLNDEQLESMMTEIYRIIVKSSKTLKLLELDCNSENIHKKMFPKLLEKLCTVEDLKLETILIPSNTNLDPDDDDAHEMLAAERDFKIYQEFVKTQIQAGAVKSILLPWSPNPTQCKTISALLPENIESTWCVDPIHTTEDFPTRFNKLEFMSILSQGLYTFSQPCPSVRRLTIHVFKDNSYDEGVEYDEDRIYTNLGASFVNLVELLIVRNGPEYGFDDNELSLVVENFPQLRSLHIDCLGTDGLTDDGVAGFVYGYSDELIRTRKLYLCNEISNDKMDGTSLNSLKKLEKLVLKGARISDAGIFHGLRFGVGLKHMTLVSTSREVSDWGLKWLGAGNPGLESFCGQFKTEHTSVTSGIEILRGQLPLLEFTQHLTLQIKSPGPGRLIFL